MATPVIMPRQGQSVESCIIAKWYKQKGDEVKAGDMLFTYETDKATFDEEAKVDGTLLDIFFEEGDDVPVLLNVCVIGEKGESTAEFDPRVDKKTETAEAAVEEKAVPEAAPVAAQAPAAEASAADGGRIRISPRARNLAEKVGVDYRYAQGSGPYGRIMEQDIQVLREKGPVFTPAAKGQASGMDMAAVVGTGVSGRITTADLAAPAPIQAQANTQAAQASAVQAGPDYEEVKLTNIRKVIAKSMHNSLSTSAQLTLNTSFDATEIMAFRKKVKEGRERLGLENITLNDIILYAVSRTILNHRTINAHFLDDRMLLFNNVHLGIAVDTERGLMVPTLPYANLKSLNEISREAKGLIEECQKGTISPDKLKGGTFTVTNLGTLDVESFTPVLNPPQTGILGVCNIVQRAKEVNGECKFYPAMGLSLTFDHRALDGAPAARFLQDLKRNLENFSLLLAI